MQRSQKRGVPHKRTCQERPPLFRERNTAHEADAIIAYIRDGTIGKAVTAMTSHGVAPVDEDALKQLKELLIPCPPKPTWADTRGDPA